MINTTRRQCIKLIACGLASSVTSAPLLAGLDSTPPKLLSLYNTHTAEQITCAFAEQHDRDELNHLLRDHRANRSIEMDKKLFDVIWNIQHLLDSDAVVEIVSGYRSKATNDFLRSRSPNVAKKSFHIQGKAIDFRIRGVDLKHVRNAAREQQIGGIGYYPGSNFIHVDTGPVREWG